MLNPSVIICALYSDHRNNSTILTDLVFDTLKTLPLQQPPPPASAVFKYPCTLWRRPTFVTTKRKTTSRLTYLTSWWRKKAVSHFLSVRVTMKCHVTTCTATETDFVAGVYWSRLQLKCDGTRWRTGGEAKGKLANGVGSKYPSHYLGIWCIQHYYQQ